MRWYKIFFGTFLLAFFSLVGFSSSVYALEDHVETFVVPNSGNFMPNCDLSCYQQYHYMIIEWDSPINSNNFLPIRANFTYNGSTFNNRAIYMNVTITKYAFSIDNITSVFTMDGTPPSNMTVTVTLTESLDTPCPEPDPCPEPEQCPEVSDTPYAEKFDNIEKAIYTCGAILIMLYFFYCIYRMIIKGSGVN